EPGGGGDCDDRGVVGVEHDEAEHVERDEECSEDRGERGELSFGAGEQRREEEQREPAGSERQQSTRVDLGRQVGCGRGRGGRGGGSGVGGAGTAAICARSGSTVRSVRYSASSAGSARSPPASRNADAAIPPVSRLSGRTTRNESA